MSCEIDDVGWKTVLTNVEVTLDEQCNCLSLGLSHSELYLKADEAGEFF